MFNMLPRFYIVAVVCARANSSDVTGGWRARPVLWDLLGVIDRDHDDQALRAKVRVCVCSVCAWNEHPHHTIANMVV